VIIAGKRGAEDTEALLNVAESVYAPDKVSVRISDSEPCLVLQCKSHGSK